ncbi:hypothetical protein PPERSA_05435 [Pseudocohnilembus persalinus]|uniref:Uncharacterized protein n=1 Tax=Pseudocohnilembus persalinus TaxID=266149 RepID=A0A0V0R801_PSEPJ|nr:hypothetical protein PPERSA_05435 [Pseudocohnilembus persalinus]|eukprot:KRX10615.1 hypothetical protein PPERSA_05435 [Pseudocohnilembus persalinus]
MKKESDKQITRKSNSTDYPQDKYEKSCTQKQKTSKQKKNNSETKLQQLKMEKLQKCIDNSNQQPISYINKILQIKRKSLDNQRKQYYFNNSQQNIQPKSDCTSIQIQQTNLEFSPQNKSNINNIGKLEINSKNYASNTDNKQKNQIFNQNELNNAINNSDNSNKNTKQNSQQVIADQALPVRKRKGQGQPYKGIVQAQDDCGRASASTCDPSPQKKFA